MVVAIHPLSRLEARRRELGMTMAVLAKRSGLSEPTVQRVLTEHHDSTSFANIMAIHQALGGLPLDFEFVDAVEMRERQARTKAEEIASLVQGTLGLEGQGLERADLNRIVHDTVHKLLAGEDRRLWAK